MNFMERVDMGRFMAAPKLTLDEAVVEHRILSQIRSREARIRELMDVYDLRLESALEFYSQIWAKAGGG